MKNFITTAIAAGLFFMTASAQTIAERERAQQARIRQGVASGELTRKEALKLERKEARLHRQLRRDRIDGGGLTPKERTRIQRRQDTLSRQIYREKHDNQRRLR